MHRLADPSVRDAATGRNVEVGPEIDEQRPWTEYRRRCPDCFAMPSSNDDGCAKRSCGVMGCTIKIRTPARSSPLESLIGSPYASAEQGDGAAAPSSDLLDQLHLRAVGRSNPAYMPTVVEPLL